MQEFFIVAILCGNLVSPESTEFPAEHLQVMARNLSYAGKVRVAAFACGKSIYLPTREEVDYDHFDGVYNIFWRRAKGNPFPKSVDPTFGIGNCP